MRTNQTPKQSYNLIIEQIKGKKHQKWHDSYRYDTNNCIIFKKIDSKGIGNWSHSLFEKYILEKILQLYNKLKSSVPLLLFTKDIDYFGLEQYNNITVLAKKT